MTYETKDSGVRSEYKSGMVRDTQEGKARFDLLFPRGVSYKNQILTRFAELMARGADKYEERNWEKAEGQEELDRYYSSALRHLIQWMSGEDDEDHAAAVMFNVMAGEHVIRKMEDDADWADWGGLEESEVETETYKYGTCRWHDLPLDEEGQCPYVPPRSSRLWTNKVEVESLDICCDQSCISCWSDPPGDKCSACKDDCPCLT